jgi:hypothetical protein
MTFSTSGQCMFRPRPNIFAGRAGYRDPGRDRWLPQRTGLETTIKSRAVAAVATITSLVLGVPLSAAATPQRDPASAYWVYWCGSGCEDSWRCVDDVLTIDENGSGPNLDYRYSPSCRTGWALGQGCYDGGGNLVVGLGNSATTTRTGTRGGAPRPGDRQPQVPATPGCSIPAAGGAGSPTSTDPAPPTPAGSTATDPPAGANQRPVDASPAPPSRRRAWPVR